MPVDRVGLTAELAEHDIRSSDSEIATLAAEAGVLSETNGAAHYRKLFCVRFRGRRLCFYVIGSVRVKLERSE